MYLAKNQYLNAEMFLQKQLYFDFWFSLYIVLTLFIEDPYPLYDLQKKTFFICLKIAVFIKTELFFKFIRNTKLNKSNRTDKSVGTSERVGEDKERFFFYW